jgi:DNA-directed RNA polymerase specialized sigma24 family protein
MRSKYDIAKSYARTMGNDWVLDYRDLVHDSFIKWFDKKGTNLLDEPIGRIVNIIKYTSKAKIAAKRVQVNGDRTYYRQFESYDDNVLNHITPDLILMGKEAESHILEKITKKYPRTYEQMIKVLCLKGQGYSQDEIAETLDITKSNVTYYMNNIKKLYDQRQQEN